MGWIATTNYSEDPAGDPYENFGITFFQRSIDQGLQKLRKGGQEGYHKLDLEQRGRLWNEDGCFPWKYLRCVEMRSKVVQGLGCFFLWVDGWMVRARFLLWQIQAITVSLCVCSRFFAVFGPKESIQVDKPGNSPKLIFWNTWTGIWMPGPTRLEFVSSFTWFFGSKFIYDSPPNLMEVVGATEGLILSMEEILKSCISCYGKYPIISIIYETSQDFGFRNYQQ